MDWKTIAASIAACALVAPAAGLAQEPGPDLKALDAMLPGTLVNDPTGLDWPTQGADLKRRNISDPAIPGGGAALQFEVRKAAEQAWAAQALVPLTANVKRGEAMTIGFWARTLEARTDDGRGRVGVRFQQNSDPWPGFGEKTLSIGPDWGWYEASAPATIDIAQPQAVVTLQLGDVRQTVQIGQVIVVAGATAIVGAQSGKSAAQAAFASLAALTELPTPLRDEKGKLIIRPDRRDWSHVGPAEAIQPRDERAIWLGKATRFTASAKGANRWDLSTAIPLDEGIEAGDKLLIAIAARAESAATDDGQALLGVRIQSSEPPHTGFVDALVKLSPEWRLVRIRTTATESIPASKATIALHFAEAAQAIDIGPVYVFKGE
jgi:hypothetical protein